MAGQEALYTVKVKTESDLGLLKKDVDGLKDGLAVPVKLDASLASQSLDSIKQQTAAIAKQATLKFGVDSSQAVGAVKSLGDVATTAIKPINELKSNLDSLKKEAGESKDIEHLQQLNRSIQVTEGEIKKLQATGKQAFDTKSIEHAQKGFEGLGEKAKGVLGSLGAGVAVGGLALGLEGFLEAGKKELEQQEQLKIALAQTGVKGAELDKRFEEMQAQSKELAKSYAQPVESIRALQTEIAGIGGLSGKSAEDVTKIGIAFNQLGLNSRSLKALLAGANDPESVAALDQLKNKFPALSGALKGAGTSAEKMNAIMKTVAPTLDAMKEAAGGPLGQMQNMDETGKQLEKSIGVLLVSVLQPLIPVLTGVGTVINTVIIPPLSAASKFVENNKVAFLGLGIAIGIVGLVMKGEAIATYALGTAKTVLTAITGGLTTANLALNAAFLANPVGIIIAGVVALGAVAYALWGHTKVVTDAFDGFWNILKGVGSFIGTFVSTYVDSLITAFKGIGKVLEGIFTFDFDKIKEGAADVGKGVAGAYGGAAVKGAEAFNKTVADGAAELKKQADEGTKTGDAEAEAAKKAAAAQEELAKQLDRTIEGYKKQEEGVTSSKDKAVGYMEVWGKALDEINKTGSATVDGKVFGKEWAKNIQDNINAAREGGRKWRAIEKENEARDKAAKDSVDQKDEKKKSREQDLLSIAKQKSDEAAKSLDVELRLQRAKADQVFTTKDELAVEQARTKEFNHQVATLEGLGKEKYKTKVALEVDQEAIKTLTLEAKIKIDQEKSQKELDKAIDDLTKKKIELGIAPSSEGTDRLVADITAAKSKIADLSKHAGESPGADKSIAEEQLHELALEELLAKNKIEIHDKLQQSELDLMDSGKEKELAALQEKFDKENLQFKDFLGNNRQLSADENQLKLNLEKKFQQDKLAIEKKFVKDGFDYRKEIEKAASSAIEGIYTDLTAKKQRLDQADVNLKRFELDKQHSDLVKSLQRGEISRREFDVKLEKLTSDRTKFEKSLDDGRWDGLKKAARGTFDDLSKQADDYVKKLVLSYITDALNKATAEDLKTGAVESGVTARSAANTKEVSSNLTAANSSLFGAITTAIAGNVAINPILGLALGLAEAAAIKLAGQTFGKALGFATGGIGMVGEKGPEIIAPLKDFSHMANSLVTSTAREVRAALSESGSRQGGNQGHGGRLSVTGTLKARGRDLDASLTRNTKIRQTERMIN